MRTYSRLLGYSVIGLLGALAALAQTPSDDPFHPSCNLALVPLRPNVTESQLNTWVKDQVKTYKKYVETYLPNAESASYKRVPKWNFRYTKVLEGVRAFLDDPKRVFRRMQELELDVLQIKKAENLDGVPALRRTLAIW